MKTFIVRVILIGTLFLATSSGQRGVPPAGGGPGPRSSPSMGHPGSGHFPVTGFRPERAGNNLGGYGYGFAPWGWGFSSSTAGCGQGLGCSDPSQSSQVVFVAMQPPEPPPPPPPPARPVTHEYNWPSPANETASVYALALKDGSVRFAVAVWVADGTLHYTTRRGTAGQADLDSIDRDATGRLNSESHLTLPLSVSAPSH